MVVRIRNTELDWCGVPVAVDRSDSVAAWNEAYRDYLAFRGDPVARLAPAIDADPTFALGRVFRATYTLLAGRPAGDPAVRADLTALTALAPAAPEREQGHIAAVTALAAGEPSAAARHWESVIDAQPRDLAAIRFAHDVYLHIGANDRRLASSSRAVESFEAGERQRGHVLGQLSFALEEVGRYDEALDIGLDALAYDPDDMWALHAIAHVHEMRADSAPSLALLDPDADWTTHGLLSSHLWWHRAIRLVADRELDAALAIADGFAYDETMAFTLADVTSLLVRIEAAGGSVGDRWDAVIDTWQRVVARHTCGFLDLHAALAFTRSPDAATRWSRSQQAEHRPPKSENDRLFVEVVEPVTDALGLLADDRAGALALLGSVSTRLNELGGSLAQRQVLDIVTDTRIAT